MNYRVVIHRDAEKEFARLPVGVRKRLQTKILILESHPRPPGSKKLQTSENHRIRAGDYRVIYSIDDAAHRVFVLSVGHRKDIYR